MEGLSIESKDGAVAAAFDGELTLEVTQDLKAEILKALEESGKGRLVLDLSKVSFIDSSGIGFLVSMASRLKSSGIDFHLYRPSIQVSKTLELVQLKNHFNTVESEQDLDELL